MQEGAVACFMYCIKWAVTANCLAFFLLCGEGYKYKFLSGPGQHLSELHTTDGMNADFLKTLHACWRCFPWPVCCKCRLYQKCYIMMTSLWAFRAEIHLSNYYLIKILLGWWMTEKSGCPCLVLAPNFKLVCLWSKPRKLPDITTSHSAAKSCGKVLSFILYSVDIKWGA